MRFLGQMLAQVWGAAVMGFWIFLMTLGAVWLVRKGWWMMGHDWVFTGLAVLLLGVLLFAVCLRGVWLVLVLLAGRTTGRLARRDFRNSVADLLMFVKTGLWRE